MNILVIGNGFDLAHGLPTKYGDFLEFVKVIRQVVRICSREDLLNIEWGNVNFQIKELIKNKMGNKQDNLFSQEKTWTGLLDDNVWIDYFLQCNMYQKENWIDFENEISNVIQAIDNDMQGQTIVYKLEDKFEQISNDFLNRKYYGTQITYKGLRDKLLSDLNKLIRAFEIYLCEYVEKIEIKRVSPDIEELEIDFILSFNYTHTFSRIYEVSERLKKQVEYSFDYIHGEAIVDNTIETDNMILGIDEYLLEDRKNKDIEFIAFKKFYQRLYKGTGCRYKSLVQIIQDEYKAINKSEENFISMLKQAYDSNDNSKFWWTYLALLNNKSEKKEKHNLYIFGHSLDVTDGDILRDLILNDNVHTTIYYLNKDVMGQQIANLVKVIGQDELIRRTGGITKTIEFKLQQDMVERK